MAIFGVFSLFAAFTFLLFLFCTGIVCFIAALIFTILCIVEKRKKGKCGIVKKLLGIILWFVAVLCLVPVVILAI